MRKELEVPRREHLLLSGVTRNYLDARMASRDQDYYLTQLDLNLEALTEFGYETNKIMVYQNPIPLRINMTKGEAHAVHP